MDWISSQTLRTPAQSTLDRTFATLFTPHDSVSPCFDTWYASCKIRKPYTDATFSAMIEICNRLVCGHQADVEQSSSRHHPWNSVAARLLPTSEEVQEQTVCASSRFVLITSSTFGASKCTKRPIFAASLASRRRPSEGSISRTGWPAPRFLTNFRNSSHGSSSSVREANLVWSPATVSAKILLYFKT